MMIKISHLLSEAMVILRRSARAPVCMSECDRERGRWRERQVVREDCR